MTAFRTSLSLLLILPGVALGHSGEEFIALESYGIGHLWETSAEANYQWEAYDGIDELSAETSLFLSPLPRVAVGMNVRFAEDADGDWVYSSVSPQLQFQLTDPASKSPFRVGFSIGYQFAEDISIQETVTTFEEITTIEETTVPVAAAVPENEDPGSGGGDPDPVCNPLLDLDCEPTPQAKRGHTAAAHGAPTVTSTQATTTTRTESQTVTQVIEKKTTVRRGAGGHTGIHNHDARQWTGRLIVETEIGGTTVTGNLIGAFPEDDHAYWGYGVGARRALLPGLAFGVEAIGDFLPGGEHEVITSLHYQLGEHATIRLGTGFGLGSESPDFTLRTGVLLRY